MTKIDTGNGTEQEIKPGSSGMGHADAKPENKPAAAKATGDNDLTTGHTTPGDGGDDNVKL